MNIPTSRIDSPSVSRRFRIAAFLLLALSLCQVTGCGKVDETDTVAALKKLGVITSKNSDGSVNSLANLPSESAQLTEAIGLIGKLGNPKSVTIRDASGVTAEHIAKLASIKGLVNLELHDAPIGDAELAPLVGHAKLESLYLINAKITAASMPQLAKIPKLGLLSVSGTQVDGGYEHLKKLKKFEYLVIGGVTIDEEDATNISSNSTITHVTMDKTDISEAALKILKSNPNCVVDGSTR